MRPSTSCLITQSELQQHSHKPHNYKTVNCELRDPTKIDLDFLNSVNKGRGTKNKPKFANVSEFEETIDTLEDHNWERSLRNRSKDFNSIIGRNVTGVEDGVFIQPGGVHIIIGNSSKYMSLVLFQLSLFNYSNTSKVPI